MFTSVRRRHGLKEKINTDKRSTLLCPKLRDAEHVFDGTVLAPELTLDGEGGTNKTIYGPLRRGVIFIRTLIHRACMHVVRAR